MPREKRQRGRRSPDRPRPCFLSDTRKLTTCNPHQQQTTQKNKQKQKRKSPVAARAGGIFYPLAKALCLACGSDPDKGTQKKMGAYVMKTCFQTTTVSSAMFITAMAANPLAVNLAAAEGISISWGLWALAGLIPGLFCLATVPLILYALYPPETKDTPDAPNAARAELSKLGPLSRDEKITAAAFAVTVALWIGGGAVGINAVAAATVGLAALLVTGVISWKECLGNAAAWDTLVWL